MALSLINGNQTVNPLYNTLTGAFVEVTGQYQYSPMKITGTQRIILLGTARLRVI